MLLSVPEMLIHTVFPLFFSQEIPRLFPDFSSISAIILRLFRQAQKHKFNVELIFKKPYFPLFTNFSSACWGAGEPCPKWIIVVFQKCMHGKFPTLNKSCEKS